MSRRKRAASVAIDEPMPAPQEGGDEPDLNGVREQDYLNWRHHPVSKVFLRFLMDYERQLAEKQVAIMRTARSAPEPFLLGQFQGSINAVHQMIDLRFDDMVAFYETDPEDTDAA